MATDNSTLPLVIAAAFLILTLERLGSALVGKLKPYEEMQMMELLE